MSNKINGMGAIVHKRGTAFRVWAPFADSVSVIGSFNQWNEQSDPCEPEEQGCWYVNIPKAKPGDEYQFHLTNGKQKLKRIDPRARAVTNSVGNGVITDNCFDWQGDNFQIAPWNELIIYELHIGTFNTEPKQVGSFDDAIERLPYLQDLGINAIEIMPVSEFAGDYSWGYNPAHPFAVETAYGGPEALKRFVREAHKVNIAIIMDVVYNHFGPSDLDLWQFDGWSENNKGGIYFYNDWRSATPWGDTRPDYGRGEVRQYIFDNAMMWLEDYHVDGLRYDMTLYMRSVDGDESKIIHEGFTLAQWINREIHRRYPGKITIAEDLRNNALMTLDEQHGGANFSAQWDAKFVHPVRKLLIESDDNNRSMHELSESVFHKFNLDAFERVIYTESHDEVANGKQRIVSEIKPDGEPDRYAIKRSTLGAALVLTAPGIPMLLQGQEFLRDKWFDDGRPLNWDRSERYSGIVQMYSDLIALRRNSKHQTAGLCGQHVAILHLNEQDNVIVMHRWKEAGPGDDVIAVFNFSEGQKNNYKFGLAKPGLWKIRFNSDCGLYGEDFDKTPSADFETEDDGWEGYEFSATVKIGAYACLIFSQDTD